MKKKYVFLLLAAVLIAPIVPTDTYATGAFDLNAAIEPSVVSRGQNVGVYASVWQSDFLANRVAAGWSHSLALKSDGTVWAWGSNSSGELGDGTTGSRTTPVQAKNLTDVVAVSAGDYFSLALKSDGTVWGMGSDINGSPFSTTIPVQIRNLNDVAAIFTGRYHSFALKSDGTVWAWGSNQWGQLGDGTTTKRYYPVQVQNLTGMVAIAAGLGHSIALKSDGTVWAWGDNWDGQLGNGTWPGSRTPVQVRNLTDVVAVAANGFTYVGYSGTYGHSLALKSDGTVWAWGSNTSGQLGDGTKMNRNTPVRVQNLTGVVAISAGEGHSLALKSDGTVWVWGGGNTAPVQVKNLTDVVAIAADGAHSLALKSDGTVWAWGYNTYGQLGDGTRENRTAPVQVGGPPGRTQADAVWVELPDSSSIPMTWDPISSQYQTKFTVPKGGSPGIWPGSGTYTVKVKARKNGVVKELPLTLNVLNTVPVIQSLTYSPNPAIVGRDVALNVFAVDPDDDPLTYAWTIKKPNGQQISLGNSSTQKFRPDMPGDWIIAVTVRDPYGGVATRNITVSVADFNLIATVEPYEVSRGQKIAIYASLSLLDGSRIQADSISAILPNGQPIGLRWDSMLSRYIGEYTIPDGGPESGQFGDGTYEIKVSATKYGITKEQVLRVVIRGNIKEKIYIRQIQF